MNLKIDIKKKKEGVYVVSLSGSLDSVAYDECNRQVDALLVKPAKVLIFDMKNLDYIGSLGFSILIKARRVLEGEGGVLALVNIPPEIRKIFDLVKIMPDRLFGSMEEVDEHLKKMLA
jgi:anti-anti-sigma factor